MYSVVQQVFFAVWSIPCLILAYILFRYGKRPLSGSETFTERMERFYAAVSFIMLGQVFFQTIPNATNNSSIGIAAMSFVLIGMFAMHCFQKCWRINSVDNPFYVAPEHFSMEIHQIINHETMDVLDYYSNDNLLSDEQSQQRLQVQDERVELTRRRILAFLIFSVMSFQCVLEGFFLIYRESLVYGGNWVIVSFYFINKAFQTLVLCVFFLHAFFHGMSERQWNWYFICVALWFCVLVLSCIPVLLNVQFEVVAIVVNHFAVKAIYLLAAGIQVMLAVHLLFIDRKRIDLHDTVIRLIISGAVCIISWTVGFFT